MKFAEVLKKHQLADRVSGECIKDLQECEDLQDVPVPAKENPYVPPRKVATGSGAKAKAKVETKVPSVSRPPVRKKAASMDS